MRRVLVLGLMACIGGGLVARAEKAVMTAEENAEVATDVAVGTVRAIYAREKTEGDWKYQYLLAEVDVEKVEKGKSLAAKSPVYARYWHRSWIGKGHVPPSTNGHRGLPGEGDKVRVYLARNAYDGFSFENKDGGYNVIGCDGWEVLKEAAAPEKPAGEPAPASSAGQNG